MTKPFNKFFILLAGLLILSPLLAELPLIQPLRLKVRGPLVLREDGQAQILRGFNLSNFAHGSWKDGVNTRATRLPEWVLTDADINLFKRIGVNYVRYTFNYDLFEPENASANFEIVDRHLQQLSDQGIYVILNLHITKGRSSAFLSKGLTIFEDEELWKDFESMWKRIAQHYRNDNRVVGFEFFNEPKIPSKGRALFEFQVNEFVKQIRKIAPDTVFVIPNPEGATLADGKENWDFQPFFKVQDSNVIYTFHYYEPKDFTHQKFWASIPANGMSYPFTRFSNLQYIPFQTPMQYKEEERPELKNGWKWTKSKFFYPPKGAIMGTISFVAGNDTGSIYFDNPKLVEANWSGVKKEILLPNPSFRPYSWNFLNKSEFNPDQYYGLGYYVADKKDDEIHFLQREPKTSPTEVEVSIAYPGFDDQTSLKIKNAYTDVTSVAFDYRVFPIFPKPGFQYQVLGLIKMENSKAYDIKKKKFNNIDISWFKADKELIDQKWIEKDILKKYLEWARKEKVPVLCGEFGTSNFIKNDYKLKWAADLTEILNRYKVHWAYWDYKAPYGWGYSFSVVSQQTDHPENELFVNYPMLSLLKGRLQEKK